MRFVADANEIFSFFNKYSKSREFSFLFEMYSPKFALVEIEEHKKEIKERFNLSDIQYDTIHNLLCMVVRFVDFKEYKEFLNRAMKISKDPDDIDYIALALKLNCPIWSEDKDLKKQNKVKVLTTKELLELLNV